MTADGRRRPQRTAPHRRSASSSSSASSSPSSPAWRTWRCRCASAAPGAARPSGRAAEWLERLEVVGRRRPHSRPASPAARASASRSPARWSPGRGCVFADEPTGALDSLNGEHVMQPAGRRGTRDRRCGCARDPRGARRRLRRPRGGRARRDDPVNAIVLGLRLAVTGGRSARLRALMTAVGVALGMIVLLVAAAVPNMVNATDNREAARSPVDASQGGCPGCGSPTPTPASATTNIRGRRLQAVVADAAAAARLGHAAGAGRARRLPGAAVS